MFKYYIVPFGLIAALIFPFNDYFHLFDRSFDIPTVRILESILVKAIIGFVFGSIVGFIAYRIFGLESKK